MLIQCVVRDRTLALDEFRRGSRTVNYDPLEAIERERISLSEDCQEVDVPEIRPKDEQPRARAAEDVGDLRATEAGVDRDGDSPEPGSGEIERQPGRAVG